VNDIRLPFALSLLGHAVLLALVVLFVSRAPPLSLPQPTGSIAVTVAPSLPQPEAPPTPPVPPPKPPPPAPPRKPPPPVAAITPPPLPPPPPTPEAPATPTVEAPPLPPQKPPVPRRVVRHIEHPPPHPVFAPPMSPPAPQQPAAARVPAPPAPPAAISSSYETKLGAWLERHKRYPESARERGEEGRVMLQFAVDRNGRVIDFAVVKSSGYPDLDAAVDNMMRGATLPPFPPDMPQSSIKVSVAIRFSLE
jgi:periplasmic protein TonB